MPRLLGAYMEESYVIPIYMCALFSFATFCSPNTHDGLSTLNIAYH